MVLDERGVSVEMVDYLVVSVREVPGQLVDYEVPEALSISVGLSVIMMG